METFPTHLAGLWSKNCRRQNHSTEDKKSRKREKEQDNARTQLRENGEAACLSPSPLRLSAPNPQWKGSLWRRLWSPGLSFPPREARKRQVQLLRGWNDLQALDHYHRTPAGEGLHTKDRDRALRTWRSVRSARHHVLRPPRVFAWNPGWIQTGFLMQKNRNGSTLFMRKEAFPFKIFVLKYL